MNSRGGRRPSNQEWKQYAPDCAEPEALYGLPQEIEFCRTCVISNQRPNSAVEFRHTPGSVKDTIHFDSTGQCDACRVAQAKKEIWPAPCFRSGLIGSQSGLVQVQT